MFISAQNALLINSVLFFSGYIITLFINRKYKNRFDGLNSISYYFLLNSAGVFVMYLFDEDILILSAVLANALILLAAIFFVIGTLRFYNKKIYYKRFVSLFLIVNIFLLYFTYGEYNYTLRSSVVGIIILFLHIYVISILHKNKSTRNSELELLSLVVTVYIFLLLIRGVLPLLYGYPTSSKDMAGFSVLVYIFIGVSGGFISIGLPSLINNHLLNESINSSNSFKRLIKNSPLPTLMHTEDGEIIYVSEVFTKITGYTFDEVDRVEKWINLAYDNEREDIRKIIKGLYDKPYRTNDNVCKVNIKNGEKRVWSFHSCYVGKYFDGRKMAMSVATDITESREADSKLQFEREKGQKYLDIIGTVVVALNNQGEITLLNKSGCELLEVIEKDVLGKNWFDEFIAKDINKETKRVFDNVFANEAELESTYENEIITKSGKKRTISWNNSILVDINNEILGVISSGEDVTEKRLYEEKLREIGYKDALTGLHNRRYYEENLVDIDIESNYPITIAMGDINGLKLINDAFGHDSGDELLVAAAKVIKEACRETDLIARIGGDEFVIVMPKTSEREADIIIGEIHAKAKATKIESIELSISFGVKTKISNENIIEDVYRSAEDLMYREKLLEIPSMRSGAIETILNTLYEKDEMSEIHSRSVSLLSEEIARANGMSRQDIAETKTAGLLHDIGKIIISSTIINKKGKLTPSEYNIIKNHPEIGFRILNSTSDMRSISNIVLCHHERWDGTGYPRGIKAKDIPIKARIITIADAFDAMTSERTYRDILSKEDALKEIIENSGTQFDPKLVEVFKEHFEVITKEL